MIHADKKSVGKWRDLPIPFPSEEKQIGKPTDLSGVSQLPPNLRGAVFKE